MNWTLPSTIFEENCELKRNILSYMYFFHSIKPTLKKVSKYENKFAKLQKKAAEFNFRNQLKTVKKKEFTMDEEEAAAVIK